MQRQPAQRMLRGVTQPPKAVRRGWTLVEMLVVVTIVSILLATVAVTIQTIMRQQRSFAQGITEQRTLALLARQIRADVHAAARVEMVAARAAIGDGKKAASDAVATSAIRCSGPLGRSVRYTLHNGQLLRVVHEPGEKAARRQAFSLPRGAAIRLVEPAEAKSPIATIQLDYPAGHTAMEARLGDVARRKLIIEALIGSDLRWQKPGQAPAPTDPSAEAVP